MLTDTQVRAARPTENPYKLADSRGLYLQVNPNGGRYWRFNYRFNGKQRTLALGTYPDVSLARARERHYEARRDLAEGIDPGAVKQALSRDFETVARAWLAHWRPGRSERYVDYVVSRLEGDIFPDIGARPVAELTAADFRDAVRKVERRGAAEIARRLLQNCGQIMRYAVANDLAPRNPVAEVKPSDILKARKKRNYPEREIVSIAARKMHYEPLRPLHAPKAEDLSAQQALDDLLDLEDVTGKRLIETRLHRTITIREENSVAALEVMSRFAANPKWLIYLPPTMSPSETSRKDSYLEYPTEALDYYRRAGVETVVCEEKHMGSRAVVVICRDEAAALKRFGVQGEGRGITYTRTGRRFFADDALQNAVLDRLGGALDGASFWEKFQTDWFCLDCELMPWSVKAEDLLRAQYAPTGAAARAAVSAVLNELGQASQCGLDVSELEHSFAMRASLVDQYVNAYRHYCWPVAGIDDIKLAPFHLLASEGVVHADKTHVWHMETLAEGCKLSPELLLATPFRTTRLDDDAGISALLAWWEEMTGKGGEGMVMKPADFVVYGKRGLLQPAIKCRGPEYLRIIYGPEYSRPEHLERLRERGLSTKRSMALREFALGIESLERFVRREPLRRVHECVFGVLALESEPVDPRL